MSTSPCVFLLQVMTNTAPVFTSKQLTFSIYYKLLLYYYTAIYLLLTPPTSVSELTIIPLLDTSNCKNLQSSNKHC